MLTSPLIASTNNLDRYEGTHTIVHAHYSIGIDGHQSQSVLYAVEARLATRCHLMRQREVVFATQLLPVFLLVSREDQNNPHVFIGLVEDTQCAHQHRFTTNWQELLGYVSTHSQTLSTSNYNYIIHNEQFTINN